MSFSVAGHCDVQGRNPSADFTNNTRNGGEDVPAQSGRPHVESQRGQHFRSSYTRQPMDRKALHNALGNAQRMARLPGGSRLVSRSTSTARKLAGQAS